MFPQRLLLDRDLSFSSDNTSWSFQNLSLSVGIIYLILQDTQKNNVILSVEKTSTISGRDCDGQSSPKGLHCNHCGCRLRHPFTKICKHGPRFEKKNWNVMLHHLEPIFLIEKLSGLTTTHSHDTARVHIKSFIGGHLHRCEKLERVHWSGGRRLVGRVGRRAVVGKTDFYWTIKSPVPNVIWGFLLLCHH